MTLEEMKKLPEEEQLKLYKKLKKIRSQAKVVNFSGVYGAGPPKIAKTLDCSLEFATRLHKTYWERNKAVKTIAKKAKIKSIVCLYWRTQKYQEEVEPATEEKEAVYKTKSKIVSYTKKQKFLYNPVSKMYYFLKADKDKFSTLNQGTGVYVFDSWLRRVRERFAPYGIKVCLQYHDEILVVYKKEYRSKVDIILKEAMELFNKEVKLNVEIQIDTEFGKNYAECH